MSTFSEKLKSAIDDSGVPVGRLAELSGISASMLYKIQSGSRLPDSLETLERLLSAMVCALPQRMELLQAYKIERIGVDRYACFQEFKGMLSDIANLNPTIRELLTHTETELPSTIMGPRNVNVVVQALLEQEVLREGGYVDMIVPLRYQFCFDLLSQVLVHCVPGFRSVRHLFCLKSSGTDEALLYNMTAIRALLPRMLSMPHYDPWYSYLPDPDDGTVPFPYYILTSGGVLLLDGDLHSAVFLRDRDICMMYSRSFENSIRRFTPVMRTGQGNFESYFAMHNQILSRLVAFPSPVTLAAQPCILPCMSPAAAAKYVPQELLADSASVQQMELFFSGAAWAGYSTFFSLDGLRLLVETGQIMEMLGEEIPRFQREDVMDALEELVRRARNGTVKPYLMRQELLHGECRLSMGLYGTMLFIGCEVPSRRLVFNDLTEATLAKVLRDYVDNALQLGDVFSVEETIQILEREIRAFRRSEL